MMNTISVRHSKCVTFFCRSQQLENSKSSSQLTHSCILKSEAIMLCWETMGCLFKFVSVAQQQSLAV